MGFFEYFLLAGAIIALVLGAFRLSRIVSYVAFLIIAGWPTYSLAVKNGWSFGTVVVLVAVAFAICAGLYWVAGRFARTPNRSPHS